MDGWIWRTDVDLGLGGLWDPVLGTTEVRKISSQVKHRSMGKNKPEERFTLINIEHILYLDLDRQQ